MRLSDFDETKYGGKSDFFDLIQGDNKLRIVSEFAAQYSHFENRKFLGNCVQTEDCPHCISGNKPSVKFLCHIIDRNDGVLKIARFGAMILKQLKQYSLDPQYKFEVIPNWDCNIKKSGEGLETEYTVIPDRGDIALTEEEKKKIADLKHPMMIVDALNKKSPKIATDINSSEEGESEIRVEDIPF